MPKTSEAQARIKINKLLEAAGWRFYDDERGKANIALEPNVKLVRTQVDAMGNDFETAANGYIDFLLLDDKGFPLLVLEAKAEHVNSLTVFFPQQIRSRATNTFSLARLMAEDAALDYIAQTPAPTNDNHLSIVF